MIMDIVFKVINEPLREDSLIPVRSLPEDEIKEFEIEKSDITEIAKLLNVKASNLYYVPAAGFKTLSYWDNVFYYTFFDGCKELLENQEDSLQVKGFKFHKEKVSMFLEKEDWKSLFSFLDKKVTFLVFDDYKEKIPKEIRKDVFLEVYSRSEYGFEILSKDDLRELMNLRSSKEESIPSKYETCTEGYYTLYRGESNKSRSWKESYSWTLDYDIASFFAKRFGSEGTIYTARIHKSKIKSYIGSRNEAEVLLFPEDIQILSFKVV